MSDNNQPLDDEAIVTLFLTRDESAIAETDRRYGRYCLYIARHILGSREDAEETVNDTFLKAWNSIPPAQPNPLKAFLGRLTRQLSINRLEARSAAKRGGGEYALSLDELEDCIPDAANNGEDIPDASALRDSLDRFLRTLSDEDRALFLQRYWYMTPISVLATETASGESRIKSRLSRIRTRLRTHLEREGFTV